MQLGSAKVLVANNIVSLRFWLLSSPFQRKSSGLGDSHHILGSLPRRYLELVFHTRSPQDDYWCCFSYRRRSHETTVCSVLPRQLSQSHHPPWQNGESEGDFLPAGLQGRAGYKFPGKPWPRNKGKEGAASPAIKWCFKRLPAPVHPENWNLSLPSSTEMVLQQKRPAPGGRCMKVTSTMDFCCLLRFLDEASVHKFPAQKQAHGQCLPLVPRLAGGFVVYFPKELK